MDSEAWPTAKLQNVLNSRVTRAGPALPMQALPCIAAPRPEMCRAPPIHTCPVQPGPRIPKSGKGTPLPNPPCWKALGMTSWSGHVDRLQTPVSCVASTNSNRTWVPPSPPLCLEAPVEELPAKAHAGNFHTNVTMFWKEDLAASSSPKCTGWCHVTQGKGDASGPCPILSSVTWGNVAPSDSSG